MRSYWEETSSPPSFEPLARDIQTDVLIIGGGIAGILCAAQLKSEGADYALAEAETVFGGVTKNTTAKITSQHGLIYASLIRRFGEEGAKQYLLANEAAIEAYRGLCADIDCDFVEKDAYVYSLNGSARIDEELSTLRRLGYPAERADSLPLPFPVAGAVRFPKQAQFHPLKFLSHIAKGLNIYEHTAVRELKGTFAVTSRGSIRARRIIVATHFPFINKHGGYFLKLYQHRSYVIALENAPNVDGMYVDESKKGLSFCNQDGLLLIGGGSHRTGKTGGDWRELREFAAKCYPKATERYSWATQDCMTLDGVPYIGRYGSRTEGLYVAAGFNKWGMTNAMAASRILSDMLAGRRSPYADVFSPTRSMLRPQLAANALEAAVSLITPTVRRCPHLGCALKWNAAEHTWDCPCHGSRFTEDGRLIDNPATGDLKP